MICGDESKDLPNGAASTANVAWVGPRIQIANVGENIHA
jgi:hypothetical protein